MKEHEAAILSEFNSVAEDFLTTEFPTEKVVVTQVKYGETNKYSLIGSIGGKVCFGKGKSMLEASANMAEVYRGQIDCSDKEYIELQTPKN